MGAGTDAFLAIDLGATNVRAAIGDRTGTILARAARPTPQGPDGDAVTAAVLDCARTACRHGNVAPETIQSAGIGSMGPLDRGAVVDPPNVPVGRVALVEPVRDAFGLQRVVLHNDAVAGAIGERRWADAPDQFVYLTLSTGIGAGAVVDARVLSGYRGNAAEVGHVTVDPEGRLTCGCGGAGHWEAYCSGSAIPRLAAVLAADDNRKTDLPVDAPPASDDDERVVPEQPFDAADVFARADTDSLAERTLTEVGRLNALGVAATVHAFAPEAVRVGGAVALENQRAVLNPIRERLPEHLAVEAPTVDAAALGSDAVLLGALAAAIDAQ